MDIDVGDLQVVVLDNVKKMWSNEFVRELFNKTLQIKFDGYDSVYGSNVISVDKIDFFGTHIIVCYKNGPKLEPIFAFKSATMKRCHEFLHAFPAVSLVKRDGNYLCNQNLQYLLDDIKNRGEEVSYESSLSQSILVRKNKTIKVKQLIHEVTMMLAVSYHKSYGIENMLACGVIEVKTNKFFQKMGLSDLCKDSYFKQTDINDNLVSLMYTKKFFGCFCCSINIIIVID